MLDKLQKIPFCPLLLCIKFLAQNLVDLLNSPSAVEEFPYSGRDRVLQAIELSDLRPRLLDGHKQDHTFDHSPGKQRILFKALLNEVFQLVILPDPDVRPNARLA